MQINILSKKIEELPAPLKKEVEDFVDFLIYKNGDKKISMLTEEAGSSYQYNGNSSKSKAINSKPVFGSGKGIFGKITDDFDEPLDEMKDYM